MFRHRLDPLRPLWDLAGTQNGGGGRSCGSLGPAEPLECYFCFPKGLYGTSAAKGRFLSTFRTFYALMRGLCSLIPHSPMPNLRKTHPETVGIPRKSLEGISDTLSRARKHAAGAPGPSRRRKAAQGLKGGF